MMNKRGVTLIEATICVLVGSIVMLAASKMLSSGMRTSTKGAALLTNVQNVSILVAQIEEDVQRAFNVSFGPSGIPENSLNRRVDSRSGQNDLKILIGTAYGFSQVQQPPCSPGNPCFSQNPFSIGIKNGDISASGWGGGERES